MNNPVLLATMVLATCLFLGAGCDRGSRSPAPAPDTSAPAVDTALLAFLSEARALHHRADVEESRGNGAAAMGAMRRLVTLTLPPQGPKSPEVQEVLADAYARLAELEIASGNLVHAEKSLDDGFTHAPEATYFRGHLMEVRGLWFEARAKAFADAGDAVSAGRARDEAVRTFDDAVRIQDQFIQRTLDGGAAPR
ncbi:MAG: hypothetical protein U0169_18285 [Polyangiaceae bacterium]